MSEQIKQIASRLKEIREKSDLTVEWAAAALGITIDELEVYESGETDIPVSFLYMAAKKYDVELSTLLRGDQPCQDVYTVVRRNEGMAVVRNEQYQYQSLCVEFAQKKIEPLLVTVKPKDENEKHVFNRHPGQEFHYILKGCMKVVIGKNEVVLNPGDSLIFNCEYPHALEALDNKPVKFLAVII